MSINPNCDAVECSGFAADEVVIPTELRVADGPEPRFGDLPRWDLSALGLTPNLNAAQAHLRFDIYPDEEWIQIAKTLAMAMLNPIHPVVREAGIYRSNRPYKLKTLRHVLTELKYLAQWANTTGRPAKLASWNQGDCDAYVLFRKTRSASAHRSADDLLRHLNDFRGLMPDGGLLYRAGHRLPGRSSGEIKTLVIPPDTFWPLVRACWAYISIFSADIIAARDELATYETRSQQAGRPTTRNVDETLDTWLSSAEGFVPVHTCSNGRGRRGEINWDGLALCTTPRLKTCNFYGPRGAGRQDRVREAIRNGLPIRYGYSKVQPAVVQRSDGTHGPWISGFDRTNTGIELTQLRNATYIFVATMTMMRDSEVQSIAGGSVGTHYGAPAVTSTLHKMQPGGGVPSRWWVSEPVVKALASIHR